MSSLCKIRKKVGSVSPVSTEEAVPLTSLFSLPDNCAKNWTTLLRKYLWSYTSKRLDQRALSFKCILHVHLTPGACDPITLVRLLAHCPQSELGVGCANHGAAQPCSEEAQLSYRMAILRAGILSRDKSDLDILKTMSCVSLTQLLVTAFLTA